MKRITVVFLLLLILLHVYPSSAFKNIKVIKVFDGDTILAELDNGLRESIRFLGIDAPEASTKRFGYVEYLGFAVLQYMEKLILNKRVDLKIQKQINGEIKRCRYGRVLAFVYINGLDVCRELLVKGYAKVYRRYPSSCYREFLSIEIKARKNRIGIWNCEKRKKYYRNLYEFTRNIKLIPYFFIHDKPYLRQLLQ